MTRLRVLFTRIAAMLTGRRREDELREEMDTHLALLADEYRRQGLSDEDARLAARRAFGAVDRAREAFRDQRRLPPVDALIQDIRFGGRQLLRERASTLAAIGILTLGVGSTVVMTDMLDRLLIRPPSHVAEPERVRRLYDQTEGGRPTAMVTNNITVDRLSDGLKDEVAFMAAYFEERLGVGRGPDAGRVVVVTHTSTYFDVLGITPHIGVLPSAKATSVADTAVISHALWQQRFGGSADVLDRTLRLGTRVYTVVAVTPPGFAGIDSEAVEVWLPIESRAGNGVLSPDWRTSDGYYWLRVIARLRPGVERIEAEEHASAIFNAGLAPQWADGKQRRYRVLFGELAPARQPGGTEDVRVALWVAGVSSFVLLIACGNVGNLLFVRGLRRSRELALKTALGATRGRLLREILTEAALLAVLSSIAGLLFVISAGALVRRVFLPPAAAAIVPLDGRLIALTVLICVVATLLLGLLPAARLTTEHNLAPGRAVQQERPSRLLDLFVGLQVALSLPLIVGASLFALSFWQARQVNFGIETTNVAVVSTNLVEVGAPADNHPVHRRIQEQLSRLPQVQSVALIQTIPLISGFATVLEIPGVDTSGPAPFVNGVDASYFDVMSIRMVAGRAFTSVENVGGGRPVLVVNESMARKYWPGESPLGRCVRVGIGSPCAEVVGVTADTATWPSLAMSGRDAPMGFLVPIEQYSSLHGDRALLVRTTEAPGALLPLLRTQAQAAGADLPYVDVWAFDDLFQPSLKPLRLGSTVFMMFGLLAMAIAAVGLAAVTAHGVTRRTRELGIRMALGAAPENLVQLMLRRNVAAVVAGLVCGGLLAYFGQRLLRTLLFGVEASVLWVLGASAVVVLLVSMLASYLPARRAGHVNPADALRAE